MHKLTSYDLTISFSPANHGPPNPTGSGASAPPSPYVKPALHTVDKYECGG